MSQLNEEEAEYQVGSQSQEERKTAVKKGSRETQVANPYSSIDFLDEEEAKVALADSDEEIENRNAILELSDEEGEETKKSKNKKPDGWIPYPPL